MIIKIIEKCDKTIAKITAMGVNIKLSCTKDSLIKCLLLGIFIGALSILAYLVSVKELSVSVLKMKNEIIPYRQDSYTQVNIYSRLCPFEL